MTDVSEVFSASIIRPMIKNWYTGASNRKPRSNIEVGSIMGVNVNHYISHNSNVIHVVDHYHSGEGKCP
jgi:hypothetical protein